MPVNDDALCRAGQTKVFLVWGTVNGGWVVEDYHFRGKRFTNATRTLAQAEVGADGRLSTRFAIPEDYGGVHEVILSDHGTTLAQNGVEVSQTFEMRPTEGPVGTPIENGTSAPKKCGSMPSHFRAH